MVVCETKTSGRRGYLARLVVFFVICFVLLLYLIFSPRVSREFYDVEVLFKPRKCDEYVTNWYGRTAKEVSFKNKDGKLLGGLYLPSPEATHVILIHHGQSHNCNLHMRISGYLIEPKNSIFIYDYAGFGKSEGTPSVRGMIDDGQAAYDYLVNILKVDPKKIVQYGVSLGTGPAAYLAGEKPCAGLVLVSPYTSLEREALEVFPLLKIYPEFLLTDYDINTLANIKRVHVPLLIVHGAEDSMISVRHGEEVFAAANQPKTFLRIENGGHWHMPPEEKIPDVLNFIHGL